MALEIKILDYGDIELEASFLVLGRDCGRTRRVPTYGFLILGGPWPVVVDTGNPPKAWEPWHSGSGSGENHRFAAYIGRVPPPLQGAKPD